MIRIWGFFSLCLTILEKSDIFSILKGKIGTSLVVQRLRLHTANKEFFKGKME